MTLVDVDKIKIGSRFRKDLGDVGDLAASIKILGLLQPIVVDGDFNLIAGERRIQAHIRLGKRQIEATIVDLDDHHRLRAQQDENLARKQFTMTEAVAVAEAMKAAEGRKAEARMLAGVKPPADSAEGPGRTRDKIAVATGYSHDTIRKATAVVAAAKADPALAPVVEEMERTGRVEPAYRQIHEVAPDPACGGLDDLVYSRGSRRTRQPDVIFAKILVSLSTEAGLIRSGYLGSADFSGVTATPGQLKVLTDVISTLTWLRKTVSKSTAESDDVTA